tara:strand:- start:398 stop:1207 length:810 start_codon:yes stop_codon:yes gene_type:complete
MNKRNSFGKNKKRRRQYTPEEEAYFDRWEEYFNGETDFQYLIRCDNDKKISLRDWFVKQIAEITHPRTGKLWMLECGLVYSIDRENMLVTELIVPETIYRVATMKVPKLMSGLADKAIQRVFGEKHPFEKERGLSKRDWHKAAFRYNNNFFFKECGYTVTELELAPGWHQRVGMGKFLEEQNLLGYKYKEKDALTEKDRKEFNLKWSQYRNEQVERIVSRFLDIMHHDKYKGAKIKDAPIVADSDGVLWKATHTDAVAEAIKKWNKEEE